MLLAFGVYFFLIAIMLFMSVPINVGSLSISVLDRVVIKKIFLYIPIVLASIVLGYRYGVGVDYFSYENLYNSQSYSSIFDSSAAEPIFGIIYQLGYHLGLSFNAVLSVLTLFSFYFLYKSFANNRRILFWVILFFFFSGQLFWHLNILRQSIALSILIYSVKYVVNRRPLHFFFFVLLASGFHVSSIFFVFAYLSVYINRVIYYRKLQVLLLLISIVFSKEILNAIISVAVTLMDYTPYSRYGTLVSTMELTSGSGLGMMVKSISDFIIICYVIKLADFYVCKKFNVYYIIYFVGAIMANVFGLNLLLNRIAFLFVSFRFIILAFLLNYLCCNVTPRNKFVVFGILLLFFGYFVGMILWHNNDCSPFKFVFSV